MQCLVVLQNLTRHQALGFADAVDLTEGSHCRMALTGNRLEGLTLLYLVVAGCRCVRTA